MLLHLVRFLNGTLPGTERVAGYAPSFVLLSYPVAAFAECTRRLVGGDIRWTSPSPR